MLGPSRLLTCGAHRPGRVAGTGPAAGTQTQARPARLVQAVQAVGGPAARVAWGTRMRDRPVLAPMA